MVWGGKARVEVRFEDENMWLTQAHMAELFDRDQSVISKHIKNVFSERELDEKSNMQNMHTAISDKPVVLYSLDVIISVGYRVKSLRGTQFRQIEEICETYGGGTPSTTNDEYWQEGTINWATPTDMTSLTGPFIFDTEKKITDKGLKNSSTRLLSIDSILMTSRATVGILAISKIPICTNQGFIAVVCSNYPSHYFMFCLLKNRLGQIRSLATGSTFPEISRGVFRKIIVTLPDEDTVLQFDQIVKPMFEKIAVIMLENQKLAVLRDLLLPKLIRGEIRV